ncbi:uncharacterized protein LOC110183709 [Drosophila serrata]|uniref:uncharacterized protein LOC110183709 n=1 Tax=Drosophila serrata TaxID=7274 RepID=UPI000A1D049C|nr:uncharacterized protein LOC110183709 [Drosophila serrata]
MELALLLEKMNLSAPSNPRKMFCAFDAMQGIVRNISDKLALVGFQKTKYMDFNLYIDLPNTYYAELDLPVKLNFPDIQPIRNNNGLIYLKALNVPCSNLELLSVDGFVRNDCVQHYVNSKLNDIIATAPYGWSMEFIHGRHYYHTIEAKSELITVYINIVPVFEFENKQWPLPEPSVPLSVRSKHPWFAVPWQSSVNQDHRAFTVYAPFWLTQTLEQYPNSIQFLNLLMSCHAKRFKDFPSFSIYMLKSFVLQHVFKNGDVGHDQLIHLMPELMARLNNGRLESILIKDHNMMECMSFEDLQKCLATLKDLHTEAPYDSHEFWDNLLERVPAAAWFSKYISLYSYSNQLV